MTGIRVLLVAPPSAREEALATMLAAAGHGVERVNTIPPPGDPAVRPDTAAVMVEGSLLTEGAEAFQALMETLPDSAVVYLMDQAHRIGLHNSLWNGIYDYLVFPCSEAHLRHVLEVAIDRRARFLLEKYYQRYLEEQVEAQLQWLADQRLRLLHADRLSSIGQITAGIMHELNNPLMYMKLNLETLDMLQQEATQALAAYGAEHPEWRCRGMDAAGVAGEMASLLQGANRGIGHIERIIANMRRMARREPAEGVEFDLHQAINNALAFARPALKRAADVQTSFCGGLPLLKGDPQMLEQLFLNLLLNAAQALEETPEGRIHIVTERVADTVGVTVRDNGPGIPPETLARVFDPFFTTKGRDQGTGLGLAISREIAAAFGGSLRAESEVGKGAAFVLSLPITGAEKGSGA